MSGILLGNNNYICVGGGYDQTTLNIYMHKIPKV